MLSLKQLKDYCLEDSNTNRKCRYLCQDDADPNKFYCLKMTPKAKKIDDEISVYIDSMNRRGKNPYLDNLPMGDNCNGYPLLRHIEQGYDKKN